MKSSEEILAMLIGDCDICKCRIDYANHAMSILPTDRVISEEKNYSTIILVNEAKIRYLNNIIDWINGELP